VEIEIENIKAKDVAAKLKEDSWMTLDVREKSERSAGSLEGLHIPLKDLEKLFITDAEQSRSMIDPGQNLIVYCRCGNRSITAIEKMTRLGFKGQLLNLEGGMMSVFRERAKSE